MFHVPPPVQVTLQEAEMGTFDRNGNLHGHQGTRVSAEVFHFTSGTCY